LFSKKVKQKAKRLPDDVEDWLFRSGLMQTMATILLFAFLYSYLSLRIRTIGTNNRRATDASANENTTPASQRNDQAAF
jgi:hypothetical protein